MNRLLISTSSVPVTTEANDSVSAVSAAAVPPLSSRHHVHPLILSAADQRDLVAHIRHRVVHAATGGTQTLTLDHPLGGPLITALVCVVALSLFFCLFWNFRRAAADKAALEAKDAEAAKDAEQATAGSKADPIDHSHNPRYDRGKSRSCYDHAAFSAPKSDSSSQPIDAPVVANAPAPDDDAYRATPEAAQDYEDARLQGLNARQLPCWLLQLAAAAGCCHAGCCSWLLQLLLGCDGTSLASAQLSWIRAPHGRPIASTITRTTMATRMSTSRTTSRAARSPRASCSGVRAASRVQRAGRAVATSRRCWRSLETCTATLRAERRRPSCNTPRPSPKLHAGRNHMELRLR
jgi:hypothetical protein